MPNININQQVWRRTINNFTFSNNSLELFMHRRHFWKKVSICFEIWHWAHDKKINFFSTSSKTMFQKWLPPRGLRYSFQVMEWVNQENLIKDKLCNYKTTQNSITKLNSPKSHIGYYVRILTYYTHTDSAHRWNIVHKMENVVTKIVLSPSTQIIHFSASCSLYHKIDRHVKMGTIISGKKMVFRIDVSIISKSTSYIPIHPLRPKRIHLCVSEAHTKKKGRK